MLQARGAPSPADPDAGALGSSLRTTVAAVGTGWRETGNLGRIGLVGVALSALLAIVLGFEIRDAVRREALQVRTDVLQELVAEATATITTEQQLAATAATILPAVTDQLGGGEVVGVAIRDADGDVVRRSGDATTQWRRPESGAAPRQHVEQHPDGLLHFHLPVLDASGAHLGSVDVLQTSASFDAMLNRITLNVGAAILIGLGLLGLAMGGMVVANARVITSAHDETHRLLQALLRAEEHERRRIIGSLHDDVGQPLYRLLYGLEGCRARIESSSPLAPELDGLVELVHEIDATLHDELRHLHRGVLDDLDLRSALEDLVSSSCDEAGLAHRLEVELDRDPGRAARSALLRTAQEAITNVRKHARAGQVALHVAASDSAVWLEVVDDGDGFAGRPGLGLTTARERLEAMGGGLRITDRRGSGTRLVAWVPDDGGRP